MEFAYDDNKTKIDARSADPKGSYYCPSCGGRVIVKNQGRIKRPHFAHKDILDCDTWTHPMSEWHLSMQDLFDSQYREIVCEKDGIKHRADILKDNVVFEFQYSSLPEKEYIDRNSFYRSLGFKVIWVFNVQDQFLNEQISQVFKGELAFDWKWAKKMLRYTPALNDDTFALFFWTGEDDYYQIHKVIKTLVTDDGFLDFSRFKFSENKYNLVRNIDPILLLSKNSYEALKPYSVLNLKSKCPRDEMIIEHTGGNYGCINCAYCAAVEQNYAFNEDERIYCCYPRIIDSQKNTEYHPYSKKSGNISLSTVDDFKCNPQEETGHTLLELLKESEYEPIVVKCVLNGKVFLIEPLKSFSSTNRNWLSRDNYPLFNSSEVKTETGELYLSTSNHILYQLKEKKIWELN